MSAEGGETCVYYDGSCVICRAEIGLYRTAAGDGEGLRFVDVSKSPSPLVEQGSGEGAVAEIDLGEGLDRASAMARFHIRRPDGSLASGAEAFVAIWERLPGWRIAARLARLPGAMVLLEGAYRLSLVVRPALSRALGRLLDGKTGGSAQGR